jgi:membrane protease YdiL (CAAX protease family)
VTALVVIAAFPLVAGVGYGLFNYAGQAVGGPGAPARLARYGMVVYAVLLVLPLALALIAWEGGIPVPPILRPEVVLGMGGGAGLSPWARLLVPGLASAVLGVASGVALYHAERRAWRALAPPPAISTKVDRRYLTDGKTTETVRHLQALPVPLLLTLITFVVVVEEALWRGYLIGYMEGVLGVPPAAALAASALAFGVNHLYFGLRNAAAKAVEGLVWGLLFLFGGLLAPVLSHLTFNLLALNVRVELKR